MSTTAKSFEVSLAPARFECGVMPPRLVTHGWWWGPDHDERNLARCVTLREDNPEASSHLVRRDVAALDAIEPVRAQLTPDPTLPTVLCVHALTGDARVGGPGGWWEPLVGPGKTLDPRRMRILCFNNLGSCYGSYGPGDADFPRLDQVTSSVQAPNKGHFAVPDAELPAPITTYDQARAILLALDALGIERVDLLAGGSVGGMVALALAALAPERFPMVIPIATLDRATPWIIGWNHIGRQGIAEALSHGLPPERALALARQIAHMTYRAGAGLMERHGRRVVGRSAEEGWSPRAPYAVQTYLEHQGAKLVQRYDARAYVSQLDAMDHHDLGRAPPEPETHESWTRHTPWTGLARVTGRLDTIAIDSDELFFAKEIHDMVVRHRLHGHEATWRLIKSPHGHDAFLMTWEPLRAVLQEAVQRIDPLRFP